MAIDKKQFVTLSDGVKGGFIGALVVLVLVVAVIVWWRPFDYSAVYIIPQESIQSQNQVSLSVPETVLLQSMRDKGYLVTPAEYTNNIVGYYNTLIAFMAVFFVVFTIAGYFAIRALSKKEVREEARDILIDSESFRKEITNTLKGIFDASYVQSDDYEERFESVEEKLEELWNKVNDVDDSYEASEGVIKKQ